MQCYDRYGTARSTSDRVSVRYLRGYAVLPPRRGPGTARRWGFSPLSARICSATVGVEQFGARDAMFQSAICADMQCYAGVPSGQAANVAVSVRYLRGYAVLLLRRAEAERYQVVSVRYLRGYAVLQRVAAACLSASSVSVRYLRGYAVLQVRTRATYLANDVSVRYLRGYAVLLDRAYRETRRAIGFSPLSARICSATLHVHHSAALSFLFQSAICADMQCYKWHVGSPRLASRFQSAICADMQCYNACAVVRASGNAVSVRYLRGYAVLPQHERDYP